VPQERLGFRAASLAVERGAEQRAKVGLGWKLGERVAAELLRQGGVAGTQEGEGALEGGAREIEGGDGGILAAGPAAIIAAAF